MSSGLDIAGLVGTWVSAFTAIAALVGIVGPLLVWQASRTERNRALNNLGEDTGGFVTKGIPVTANIRLFRRVKAPMLQDEPRVSTMTLLVWNDTARKALPASSSWTKFGLMLKAYNFEFQCGNALVVEDTQTWLPVNRVWIMIVGIIGAFGNRVDEGKLIHGVRSNQAVPGARGISRPGWMTGTLPPAPGPWPGSQDSHTVRRSDGKIYGSLYGIVGKLHLQIQESRYTLSRGADRAFFSHHSVDEIGELPPHCLMLSSLFWLAVGCLPSTDGRIFSLDDVSEILYLHHAEPDPNLMSTPYPPARGVHFPSEPDDYPYQPLVAPNAFITPYSAPLAARSNDRTDEHQPRGFMFSITQERIQALLPLARAVGAETVDVFSLVEVELSGADVMEFDQDAGASYWPSTSLWIRMKDDSSGLHNPWFLRRGDAQLLAKALLQLNLYPNGYLLGGSRRSYCRRMLCSAAESLPQLLGRSMRNVNVFGLLPEDEAKLLSAMERMMIKTMNLKLTRELSAAIFELDNTLATLAHSNAKADLIIGIIMITNPEFRSIIAQSARHMEPTSHACIELDFGGSCLKVQAALGIIQSFPVDLDVLFPNESLGRDVARIRHDAIILAALKACLKSAFLATSIDSKPLFELVMSASDIVHFG